MDKPKLIVICGPTAVGKTTLGIEVARAFQGEIISADSRQFFKEMNIGTAKPSKSEMAKVPHHFISTLSVGQEYTAGQFEKDCLHKIDAIVKYAKVPILLGGSGLYINAVLQGFDNLPSDSNLRKEIENFYDQNGLDALQNRLKKVDPVYYEKVDNRNPMRLFRAIEIIECSGKTMANQSVQKPKERIFEPVIIALNRERRDLYQVINERVNKMIEMGLVAEAKNLMPFRHQQALQTIGYKELFDFFDGKTTLDAAIETIKRNSRRYAKRQLTWLRRMEGVKWFDYDEGVTIMAYIHKHLLR